MATPLLGPNQQRHFGATLKLLMDDLDTMAATLPDAAWTPPVRRRIATTRDRVAAVLAAFGVEPAREIDPRQRLAALCGVWLARLHDLKARKLAAYGLVAPSLADRLDPAIARIEESLQALLTLAEEVSR